MAGVEMTGGSNTPPAVHLFTENSHQQGQDDAQDNAGDDGEVETEIAAGIMDVSGQPAKPTAANAGPKKEAD
jgi:hypothetical protein